MAGSMRLLSSAHPYIVFSDPTAPIRPYAILSHVWQGAEQSHEDLLGLQRSAALVADLRLSIKVRETYRLAKAFGLGWFWIDAPCIDQRNSAEVSEAILSMYRWYARSAVCFVHLPDVLPDARDRIRAPGSAFRHSIYFKRGWTLQELIAARRVIFLFADWTVLGEKDEIADVLEEITGIDSDVLTSRRSVFDVSVARRLSWASQRQTRRVEDQAYCLLGLFDIHMPINYGEGSKAFIRLQQTILSQIPDHTLFAWGTAMDMSPSLNEQTAREVQSCYDSSLFAPYASAFSRSTIMAPVPIEEFMTVVGARTERIPRFVLDHNGLECHLPVIYCRKTPIAALLACRDRPASLIALALRPHGLRYIVNGFFDFDLELKKPPTPSECAEPQRAHRVTRLMRIPTKIIAGVLRSSSAENMLHIRFTSIYIVLEDSFPSRKPLITLPFTTTNPPLSQTPPYSTSHSDHEHDSPAPGLTHTDVQRTSLLARLGLVWKAVIDALMPS